MATNLSAQHEAGAGVPREPLDWRADAGSAGTHDDQDAVQNHVQQPHGREAVCPGAGAAVPGVDSSPEGLSTATSRGPGEGTGISAPRTLALPHFYPCGSPPPTPTAPVSHAVTKTLASALILLALSGPAMAQHAGVGGAPGGPPSEPRTPLDWRALEAPVLSHHVQLTSRDVFLKAGEAYFDPGANWIIFQAVPVPGEGHDPDPFYSMYVAKLTRGGDGRVSGIEKPILVSAPGSANTCGWFHPRSPGTILFGSTIEPPATDQRSGFQVGTRTYMWLFPQEMEIVSTTVRQVFIEAAGKNPPYLPKGQTPARPVFSRPDYDAECSYSADGRFILYAHVREDRKTGGRADADIWVYDTQTGKHHALVTADGYDGGPFFSPDGKRVCYRSDRALNDLLQLFVADLRFDEAGVPVGVSREYQITDNGQVNWAPYWHPSGNFLVYGTSEVGHWNYEVFAIEIDDSKLRADGPGNRAAETLRRCRVTRADGADVLPVFSPDGKLMMWTAQRGAMKEGEQKPSSQLWIAEFDPAGLVWDVVGAAARDGR
jgi:TolB protein